MYHSSSTILLKNSNYSSAISDKVSIEEIENISHTLYFKYIPHKYKNSILKELRVNSYQSLLELYVRVLLIFLFCVLILILLNAYACI